MDSTWESYVGKGCDPTPYNNERTLEKHEIRMDRLEDRIVELEKQIAELKKHVTQADQTRTN